MCGIAGCFDLRRRRVDGETLAAMTRELVHRGPDASGLWLEPDLGLGFRRLSILDLQTGDQPICNEDGSVVMVCNGEIFNHRELRRELLGRGHVFRSRTDVEVLVHLYEELGADLVERLNGQFAFALYDRGARRLLLARDHFGVNPLYYAEADGLLLFASEIKAILRHPAAPRRIDPVGLDQVLTLPGLVSPRTLFAGIRSLPGGHRLVATSEAVEVRQYWDLDYPLAGEAHDGSATPEDEHVERLSDLFEQSVRRRLQADVPVGFFLSGGLDSSLVTAVGTRLSGAGRDAFSVRFAAAEIDEGRYQRLMARTLGCRHHEVPVGPEEIAERLRRMVFHCECPVKESFNTCALALAQQTRDAGISVVLAGEGADELFGGYPGYRFDAQGGSRGDGATGVEAVLEEELRERLWGDRNLFYERDQLAFRDTRFALYSPALRERFEEIDCLRHPLVDPRLVRGRDPLHQRSYLDFKLRLSDHLLSEHGDRMVMAHSVEARYPFLDVELVDYARRIPPSLKVKGLIEKYVVKRMAEGIVPPQIIRREKFGFRAPGSPALLQRRLPWVEELLSPERIARQGVFDAAAVARLEQQYAQPGFRLHPHLETDLLMVVLTFNILCEQFDLPPLA
jgi:asparagine synthase (glutamine-hydrolysing)